MVSLLADKGNEDEGEMSNCLQYLTRESSLKAMVEALKHPKTEMGQKTMGTLKLAAMILWGNIK